jgi:hypothetical protein
MFTFGSALFAGVTQLRFVTTLTVIANYNTIAHVKLYLVSLVRRYSHRAKGSRGQLTQAGHLS